MTSDLFAVLVIVYAGQSTVRVAINICIYTTGVAVTSPANITLKKHRPDIRHMNRTNASSIIPYIQHKVQVKIITS